MNNIKYYAYFLLFLYFGILTAEEQTLRWHIIDSSLYSSHVEVMRNNKSMTVYELPCSLDGARSINVINESEEQASTIDIVNIDDQELLIITCIQGAHSQRITLFDPTINTKEPLWQKVGSYFASWELINDELLISYDTECDSNDCEHRFITKKISWQDIKTIIE